MATLHVRLLGHFHLLVGARPPQGREWRSQQVRTILKVLLVRRERPVPTEQLLELLWPDEDPRSARRHLHVRISQLRRALDPDAPTAYVLTVQGGYAFNPQADCWLDTAEFEAQAGRAQLCQARGDLAEAVEVYEAARALYRGDLLEEDLYEDWASAERERLRERFLTVLMDLAECYAQQGRYRRAIGCCRRVLATDPCREAAYMRLLLYHYHAGEPAQALRVYERCRRVLTEELGVEPLPEMAALAAQIRRGTLGAGAQAARYPPPAYEGHLFALPYSLGRPPLVGREREYAWLVERWRDPETVAMLVAGEAGVGKSRLLDEFLGYAAAEGAPVLRATAAAASALPYAPVIAALRSLPALWRGPDLPPDTAAALAPLFPELARRGPPLGEVGAEEEGERLHAAVEGLLQARLPAGALLALDDAQRADPHSLALLARLAGRLTVVLTCRQEETPPDHPLRTALRPLRRAGRAAELTLERLPPGAVRALLGELARHDLPTLAEQLAARTGGNPLHIIATLQQMFEEGALYVDPEGHWAEAGDGPLPLPPTMRKALADRLRRLGRQERRLFDLAAVAGGELDMALLQAAGGMGEEALLDSLDALLDAGLLVEPREAGRSDLALAHDCYAEVAYRTLPPLRRRQLHRQVGEALAATAADPGSAAPALARHFEQAGDPARACDWLVRAGDAAAARYAHVEALGFYERAVALGGSEPAPIHMRMGLIAHHLARYDEAAAHQQAALARWQALGEAAQEVRAHYALAETLRELGRYDEAAAQARAGLEVAANLPDPALAARGHIVLSNALRSGQLAPAAAVREHLEQALALARPAEAWQWVGEATFWLGVVTVNRGDPRGALAYDREALALFAQSGQAAWQALAHNNTAYHALLAGQPEPALAAAREGLALARRIGALNAQGWLLSTLGEVQTYLGHLDAAQGTLEEGLALVVRWGPPRLQPGFLADLARVAIARRDWPAALARLEEALSLALATAPQFVPRLRVYFAEARLGAGDVEEGEAQAQQARQAAQGKGQRSVEGQAWRMLAAAHAAAGRAPEAEAAFARSVELLEGVGDGLEAARTRRAWGHWLAAQDGGRAEELLTAAREAFARCGAALDLAQLEQP